MSAPDFPPPPTAAPIRPRVAVDLDGTLAQHRPGEWRGADHIGDPIPGAAEFTRCLSMFCDIVIHSCRVSLADGVRTPRDVAGNIKRWLDRHKFVYAHIWVGAGKPVAAAYVDDRAVPCAPLSEYGGVVLPRTPVVEIARVYKTALSDVYAISPHSENYDAYSAAFNDFRIDE